jgi:hypothetical protein
MDMRLRVEFFFDPEARNWNFRVPALGVIGGGCVDGDADRDPDIEVEAV